MTNTIQSSADGAIDQASEVLNQGGLVAVPTETVYGLAARANIDNAVERIFTVKGRPSGHPLILHIPHADELSRYVASIPQSAKILAAHCWPGPLTLLLVKSNNVSHLVTGGRETVAIRVPASATTRQIIEKCGHAIAAPSANRFGRVSPTTAQHVEADLGNEIELIVDDGDCSIGVESTIIDLTGQRPQLLRPGGFPLEDLEAILGSSIDPPAGESRASGMLASHYAPRGSVVLAESIDQANELLRHTPRSRILDHYANLPMYAASLYSQMRQADNDGIAVIIAVLPPASGLGRAIADRLTKASLA